MKKISIFILLLTTFNLMFSQNQTSSINKTFELEKPDSLYNKVDEPAVYPGGINAFRNNFMKTFDNSKLNIRGTAKTEARFLIDKSGYITKIMVEGGNKSLNKEMERTIKAMSKTKWEPAKIKNSPVESWFKFPMVMNGY